MASNTGTSVERLQTQKDLKHIPLEFLPYWGRKLGCGCYASHFVDPAEPPKEGVLNVETLEHKQWPYCIPSASPPAGRSVEESTEALIPSSSNHVLEDERESSYPVFDIRGRPSPAYTAMPTSSYYENHPSGGPQDHSYLVVPTPNFYHPRFQSPPSYDAYLDPALGYQAERQPPINTVEAQAYFASSLQLSYMGTYDSTNTPRSLVPNQLPIFPVAGPVDDHMSSYFPDAPDMPTTSAWEGYMNEG